MSVGRTKHKWWRVYVDGYDLSGFSRDIGPLGIAYDEANLTADMGDTVKGYMRNHAFVSPGTLNAVLDNTAATGIHALSVAPNGAKRDVLVPIGIRAAPADGDPCFGGTFLQKAYQVTESGGGVTVTMPFAGWANDASSLLYGAPFGQLLHANAVRLSATGVNDALGYDNPTGAATTNGGIFMWQVFAGNGTATIKMDDGAANTVDGDFAPVLLATSGSLDFSNPRAGIVALPNTGASAIVRRYIRWQIAFGSATTITFASAFFRSY